MARNTGNQLEEKYLKWHVLSSLEKQRLWLHQQAEIKRPCPYCNHLFDLYEASNDVYDVKRSNEKIHLDCPSCGLVVSDGLTIFSEKFWKAVGPLLDTWKSRI